MMNAMPHFGIRIGNVLRKESSIDRLPRFPTVVRAKRSRRRNRNVNTLWILRVENNRVQTHSACAWLPTRSGSMPAQARQLMPAFRAIGRKEERGIFNAGVDSVGVRERRFQVPHALEFPRMLRAVVPLMRVQFGAVRRGCIVDKHVALA